MYNKPTNFFNQFVASTICQLTDEHFRSQPGPEQIDQMTSHLSQLHLPEPEVSPTSGPEMRVKSLRQLRADDHRYLEAAQVEQQRHLLQLSTTATTAATI